MHNIQNILYIMYPTLPLDIPVLLPRPMYVFMNEMDRNILKSSVYRGLSGNIGKRTQENASPSGFFPGYIGYIR